MAWHRVEEGIYQAINPKTGTPWPGLHVKLSVRGKPLFRSAKTRSLKKARLFRASKQLGAARGEPVSSGRLTIATLLDALEADYLLNDALTRTKRAHLALFRDAVGHLHPADLVTPEGDRIVELQAAWKRGGELTNATINRRFNVLRRALRLAQKKGLIGVAPLVGRLDEKDSKRGKYMPPAVADALEVELATHVAPVFRAAYDIGIRKGQLCRTRRDDVDLTRGSEVITWQPAECKARDPHVVPLRGRALEIVRAALQVVPLGCPWLFHGPRCRPGRAQPDAEYGCVGDTKTAIEGACKRAGIVYGRKKGGYTFHSTRHAAATNMRLTMDEGDVMKVTGHKTAAVFRHHYDHAQADVLRGKMDAAAAELERRAAASRTAAQAARRRRVRPAAAVGTLRAVGAAGDGGRRTVEGDAGSGLTRIGKSAK